MITYLLKSAVCLLLLLLVYHAFLEREKMHRFNRFYLIFSLIFGLTVPLLTINLTFFSDLQLLNHIDQINSRLAYKPTEFVPQAIPDKNYTVVSEADSSEFYLQILFGFYILISSVMSVRFFRNLYSLISKVRKNEHVPFKKETLVLVDSCEIPHSFFKYIFVDKKAYRSGTVDKAVLVHEQAHARHKHSLDIIFIELLKIVFWFNPVLYFFKKAIQLNHEFLADDAVTADSKDIQNYQKLLLGMQTGKKNVRLASSIKYSITKKRIIMMTKKSVRLKKLCKQLALIPVLTGLLFLFSTTVEAQSVEEMTLQELMEAAIEKIELTDSLSAKEQEKLNELILKMRRKLNPAPLPPPPKLNKVNLPAPPNASQQEINRFNELEVKYRRNFKNYMSIEPNGGNREELENAYQKITSLANEYWDLYREVSKKYQDNPSPAPPVLVPNSPNERLDAGFFKAPPPPPQPTVRGDTTYYSEKDFDLIETYLQM